MAATRKPPSKSARVAPSKPPRDASSAGGNGRSASSTRQAIPDAKPAATRSARAKARSTAESDPALVHPSDVVDEQLARYRSMRDFGITAEPSGDGRDGRTAAKLPFCIQKHAASHLHYDFRLGWNGVLKSWAVAKGPSYFTGDKRLAVQVEDHPIEYGGFEGIIPKGQYGGGMVMLWDQGTWEPQPGHEDVSAGLRDGSLKFLMYGTKMRGKWALIRMGGRAAQERKPNWLLIKEHDDFERGPDAPPVTEAEPKSVSTGRTMDQIAASEDHVWNSKDTAATEGRAWYRQDSAKTSGTTRSHNTSRSQLPSPNTLPGAKTSQPNSKLSADASTALRSLETESQPSFLKPQLALETAAPPAGEGWLHELKLDGYRMQARKSGANVEMLTRSGLDWTYRIPAVASAVARLGVKVVTLDGRSGRASRRRHDELRRPAGLVSGRRKPSAHVLLLRPAASRGARRSRASLALTERSVGRRARDR